MNSKRYKSIIKLITIIVLVTTILLIVNNATKGSIVFYDNVLFMETDSDVIGNIDMQLSDYDEIKSISVEMSSITIKYKKNNITRTEKLENGNIDYLLEGSIVFASNLYEDGSSSGQNYIPIDGDSVNFTNISKINVYETFKVFDEKGKEIKDYEIKRNTTVDNIETMILLAKSETGIKKSLKVNIIK